MCDAIAFSDDKWNPGDIWAVANDFKVSELNIESVRALNLSILELFNQKRLVGISLKLVKKNAKYKEYNVQTPPDVDDHKLKKVLLQNKFTFSKQVESSYSVDGQFNEFIFEDFERNKKKKFS